MQAGRERKTGPQRKTRTRILKPVLALLAVLILLVFFLVPALVSSEKGRKTVLAKINNTIDGKIDFISLTMSWWKGLRVTDISFNDNAGRTSVVVKQITTKPHYASILMGSLSFGETIIDEPKVEINLKAQKQYKPKTSRQTASITSKPQPVALPIKRIDLIVNNGNLKVTDSQTETVELSGINSRLNLRPPGRQTNFDIDMTVVDKDRKSKIHADAQITPHRRTGWAMKGTSGNLTVEVNDLDLRSLGPIFALAGVEVQAKGSVSANIASEIKDGRVENLTGTVKGKDLNIIISQLKGDRLKSSSLDVAIKLHSERELINIDRLEIQSDWIDVKASGVVPKTFGSLAEFTKADSKYDLKGSFKCNLAAAVSQMPRTFGLKEGTKVTSGQLSGYIETVTGAGQRKITAQVNLVGLEGIFDGKTIALSEPMMAEAQITSDRVGLKYDKLDVSAPFGKIECTGTGKLLRYSAKVDLAKLQAELGQFIDMGKYQIAGKVLNDGELSTSKEVITGTGSLVVKDFSLSSLGDVSVSEPEIDMDYSISWVGKQDIINIDFVKANASLGQVSIKKAVLPLSKKAAKSMKLAVSANNIDLQKLQPFAVLFASFPKEIQLEGIAESDITVSSEKDSYRIVTDSTEIRNLRLFSPGQEPFIQDPVSLVFDGGFNPTENNWVVRKLQLVSPDIKIKGDFKRSVEGNKTKLQGLVDCEYDWAAVGTIASAFLPQGLKLEGKTKLPVSFSSKYPTGQTQKLLANLNTKGKLGFERADYMGLTFGPTEVDVQVQKGLMTIAPFSTTLNKGQFKFAAHTDFNQKPTLLKTPEPIQVMKDIQINDETTRKLLMYLNPVFANAVNVSGVANFHCEQLAIPLSRASRNDIEVVGTVSIDHLRLQASDLLGQILSVAGMKFRDQSITIHPTRFVLRDGFLRYDDMQMDVGDNPVNFRGTIGLDKSLDMTIVLPYTLEGRTARVSEKTVGKRISLPLKGTTDKPELDVGRLLEDQLKQQLEQRLHEALEGLFN